MDNSSPPRLLWTTPPAAIALAAAATAGAVAAALLSGTGPGRFFWSVVALVLAAVTVHGLRARPRLAADAGGVTVKGTLHTHHWTHGQLRVGLRSTRRLGRDSRVLELDGIDSHGQERLVLLGRIDLGADPVEVHERLTELRAGLPR